MRTASSDAGRTPDAASRPTPSTTSSPAPGIGRGLTTAVVFGGVLNPFNTSSLAAALVTIGQDLHASAAELALIVSVVYVVSAVAQPLMGSVAARIGPRRTFVGGLVLVVVAGVVGGLASTPAWLVASRALIALGTSSAYPSSMMLLQRAAERGPEGGPPTRQIGLLAATGNVMAAAGLPIGGLLVALFGWRSVFLVNVPLALAALALTAAFVPRALDRPDPDDAAGVAPQAPRMDPVGVTLFAVTVVALAQALTGAESTDGRGTAAAMFLAAGVAWVWWERRLAAAGRVPFIDVTLLAHSRALRDVYMRQFLLFGALYGMLYAGAQWLGAAQGLAAAAVGLAMLPQSVLSALTSVGVRRSPRVRALLLGAAAATALAGVVSLAATATSSVALLSVAGGLIGTSMGIGGVGNQAALYLASPPGQLGVSAGLLRTSSYIGGFVTSGVMAAVYADGVTDAGFTVFGLLFLGCGGLLALASRNAPRSTQA